MLSLSRLGYIVLTVGPYFADVKNNDSEIMKNIIYNNTDDFRNWVLSGDIVVLDRSFRDALPLLDSLGYKTHMPKFLNKKQAQFSTTLKTKKGLYKTNKGFVRPTKPKTGFISSTKLKKDLFICNEF